MKNEGKFLIETLSSIQAQSEENWECICVDDHSTDDSREIILNIESGDSRFKYVLNHGEGVIKALQLGYSKSSGFYITRMDGDDLMPVKKLELLKAALNKYGVGTIATGKVKYFDALGDGFLKYESWLNSLVDNNSHWKNIYKECVIASPNWMIRRSDLDNASAFNSEVYPEDYDLVFRFFNEGLDVVSSKEVTHLWRDHKNRASRVSVLYKENTFFPLKISNFSQVSYNNKRPLILWGAGKKGKSIARQLLACGINFRWLTNNYKKIDLDIYGVILESDKVIIDKAQWILAVSQPEQLKSKESQLKADGLDLGTDYFVFV